MAEQHDASASTECKMPNRMTFVNIEAVLCALEPILRAKPGGIDGDLHVDLSSVSFCSPATITALAAALESSFKYNKFDTTEITLPKSQQVQQYLQRMDFFNELGIPVEEKFRRNDPIGFRPVTHLADEMVSPSITSEMAEAVRERHRDLDGPTLAALKTCMNELAENVFYHAGSPIDALVCVQSYINGNRTEIVIADTGRGIRRCMEQVAPYAEQITDDYSAIALAIQKNVSAVADRHRGIGLWLTTELVRRNCGKMLILSDEGGAIVDENGIRRHDSSYWPGTLIVIEFRMDMPISTSEIYASGGFPDFDDDYGLDF